jgi:hypothetical protein
LFDHEQGETHSVFKVMELQTGALVGGDAVGGDAVGGDAVGEGAGLPDATQIPPPNQVQPLPTQSFLLVCNLQNLSADVEGAAVGLDVAGLGAIVGDFVGDFVGAAVGLDVGGLGARVGDFVGDFVGAAVGLDVGGLGAIVGDLVGAPVAHDPKQISTCATAGLLTRLMLFAFTINGCPDPAQLS